MIGNGGCGGSFGGLSAYLNKEEKKEWRETCNLPGNNRHQDLRLMEDTASMSKAEKPVYHLSISYADGDNPSKEQMIDDAVATLEKLDLADKQAVFVAHNDADHKHLHVMANRVDMETGKAENMWGDRWSIREKMRDIEKARGYEQTRLINSDKHLELTNGEYHQIKDQGLENMPLKAKAELYKLDKMLAEAESWREVRANLSAVGLQVKRKGRGGVIKDLNTDKTLKLSRVGREHSFGKLQKRFGKHKEFERLMKAEHKLTKHLPDREVRQAVSKMGWEKSEQGTISKATQKAFKKTLDSWNMKSAMKGLSTLAKGTSMMKNPAQIGLKLAKTVSKQLNQNRDRGLSL